MPQTIFARKRTRLIINSQKFPLGRLQRKFNKFRKADTAGFYEWSVLSTPEQSVS
jgi:hypothetical protein